MLVSCNQRSYKICLNSKLRALRDLKSRLWRFKLLIAFENFNITWPLMIDVGKGGKPELILPPPFCILGSFWTSAPASKYWLYLRKSELHFNTGCAPTLIDFGSGSASGTWSWPVILRSNFWLWYPACHFCFTYI